MKKITVTLHREVEVEVFIDETIINKEALDCIKEHFDSDIYEQPCDCDDELSEYDCGLYNYARSAAIVASEMSDVEYITLKQDHTKAKVQSDYIEGEFEKMENI